MRVKGRPQPPYRTDLPGILQSRALRAKLREKLAAHTAKFLAAGGRVQRIPEGQSGLGPKTGHQAEQDANWALRQDKKLAKKNAK